MTPFYIGIKTIVSTVNWFLLIHTRQGNNRKNGAFLHIMYNKQ